jgi:hypothetical protein
MQLSPSFEHLLYTYQFHRMLLLSAADDIQSSAYERARLEDFGDLEAPEGINSLTLNLIRLIN